MKRRLASILRHPFGMLDSWLSTSETLVVLISSPENRNLNNGYLVFTCEDVESGIAAAERL